MSQKPGIICLECNKRKARNRFQLCDKCAKIPGIEEKYKHIPKYKERKQKNTVSRGCNNKEMTMEEIENMIAEQLPTMPDGIQNKPKNQWKKKKIG